MTAIAPPVVSYTGANEPPFALPDSVELRPALTYATALGQDWLLDLFMPRECVGPSPAVVYVHGGGWRGGTRQQFWRQASHMATTGVVGACVQYPLIPHTLPSQLTLPQAAVRWLRERAAELNIDPQKIGAVGGSAGGHLAALLGTVDSPVADISSKVQAVVAFNGVFDLERMLTESAQRAVDDLLGGKRSLARDASPHWRATADSAPTLLLHGDADTTVPCEQSASYQRQLRELGVRCDLHTEPGAAHGFFNRSPYFERTITIMERFLAETLSPAR